MVPRSLYTYTDGEVTDVAAFDAADVDAEFFPEPCIACGRGASPLTLDDEGAAWCLACLAARGDPDARFIRTAWRLAAAAAARQLATTVTAGATSATSA